jgi:polyisoprenoid-binding protein YceI
MTTPAIAIPGYIAGMWDIDPVHSHVGFVARHLMVSKVRGRFDRFEGQIVTADDPLASSATATIDLNSVNTGNETRDDDLRSDNFFAAGTYPTMTYRATGIRLHGEDFLVDGELTVRGVTRPVSLKVEVNGFTTDSGGVTRAGFSATGEINRMDFGVCTNPPIVGLASEKVHLEVEAEAVLRKRR